jgi:signal recognition particle GTPase
MLSPLKKFNTSPNHPNLTESEIEAMKVQLLEIDKNLHINFQLMKSIQEKLKDASNNSIDISKESQRRDELIRRYLNDEYKDSKKREKIRDYSVIASALIVGIASIIAAILSQIIK